MNKKIQTTWLRFAKLQLVFLIFILGCTSLTQKGKNALIDGSYDESLSYFEQAVEQDKNNGEAQEGLRRAQQGWIERKLIDVRMLRLGNNWGESEALLLKVIQKENDWQVFPTGAAYSTQKEETLLFAERVENRIVNYAKNGNPISAEYEFRKNQMILERALDRNISLIRSQINTAAQNFCKEQAQGVQKNEYYTEKWLLQTCAIWKISVPKETTINSVKLFSNFSIENSIKNMKGEILPVLEESVKKAFYQSRWYDSKGLATLNVKILGQFDSSIEEHELWQSSAYDVQVPYEEKYVRAKNPKNESESSSGFVGNFIGTMLFGSNSKRERVSDNGNGTETVYTTLYRTELRYHNYKAMQISAKKSIKGKLVVMLAGQEFLMPINEQYVLLDYKHNENFPQAGLKPNNPIVMHDNDWIRVSSERLVQSFLSELQKAWQERFCDANDFLLQKNISEREYAHRCAYQINSVAPLVLQQYYLRTFGIRFEDWLSLQ